MDTIRIAAPNYAQEEKGKPKEFRCLRLRAEDLRPNLDNINAQIERGSIQMLQINCRESYDASSLSGIRNIEILHLVSDKPIELPDAESKVEGLKALYCCSKSFQCEAFPQIEYLEISNIDFSRSSFRGASSLRKLYALNFRSDDGASQLSHAQKLEEIDLFSSKSIKNLDSVSKLVDLKKISLTRLGGVTSLDPLSKLKYLEVLVLVKMKNIESYRAIRHLTSLRKLVITESAPIDFLDSAQTGSLELFGVHGTKILDGAHPEEG